MAEFHCRPLVEVLAEVPDVRKSQGRRYELGPVLALACAAMLCGYTGYVAMADWGKNYGQELAQALGFKNGKTPAVGTLFNIFSQLEKRALEEKLAQWARSVLAQLPTTQKAIAIDGKRLNGSANQGACDAHLLSAVGHDLGLTLFQVAVDDKTNEITAVHDVLRSLVLEGKVVTVDALLTQKKIARTIVEKGGTTS